MGTFLDRYGSRWILVIGGVILSVGFMSLSTMTDLWQFYLVRGIFMAMGFSLVSMLVTTQQFQIGSSRAEVEQLH